MEKKRVFVQGFKKVGPFTNRENGEIIEGVNVYFFEEEQSVEENTGGYVPSKAWLTPQDADVVMKNGAGFYFLLVSLEISGNKPKLKINGFELIKKHELNLKSA